MSTSKEDTKASEARSSTNEDPPDNTPIVIKPAAKSVNTKTGEEVVSHETPQKRILHIESVEHYRIIIEEAGTKYVMVQFSATWCNPCKGIEMQLEELAEKHRDKLIIVKVDIDNLEELAVEHDVTIMPSFMIMRNSETLEQFSGSKTEMIVSTLEKFLNE